jgi:hypothetical protein
MSNVKLNPLFIVKEQQVTVEMYCLMFLILEG